MMFIKNQNKKVYVEKRHKVYVEKRHKVYNKWTTVIKYQKNIK